MLFALDEGLGVDTQQFPQAAQKPGGAVQPDRCLQIGPLEAFAKRATEFAIHADIGVGVGQLRDIGQMAP